jgi:hypothetical protein
MNKSCSIIDILLPLRNEVNYKLEELRKSKEIGGSIDAEVIISITKDSERYAYLQGALYTTLGELIYFFNVSDVCIKLLEDNDGDRYEIEVKISKHPKCVRCKRRSYEVDFNKFFSENEDEKFCIKCVNSMCGYDDYPRYYF